MTTINPLTSTAPTFAIRCPDGRIVEIRRKDLTAEELRTVGTTMGVTLDPRQLRIELNAAERQLAREQETVVDVARTIGSERAHAGIAASRGTIAGIKRRLGAVVEAGWCCESCAAGKPCGGQ